MKVAIILIVALCHVARGVPVDSKPDAAAPAAPSPDQAPQAAPAAPDTPTTCSATVDGKSETLNEGDRYCLDDTTHRVCSNGQWLDNKCDPGSKCLKGAGWQVLCRIIVLNADSTRGQGGQQQQQQQNDDANVQNDKPQPDNAPVPKPQDKPDSPAPAPAPAPANPEPSNPAPANPPPANPPPAPAAPSTDSAPAAPAAPADKSDLSCKATVNGQEQTLQRGESYCSDDSTSRVCTNGDFTDYKCPSESKCLKSPSEWQVLCRIIVKNSDSGSSAQAAN